MRSAKFLVWSAFCCWLLGVPQFVAAEPSELAGRVAKLEQTFSNRGLLDLLQEVENLKREIKSLRGELENQTHALEQLKKSQTATYTDLDSRLHALQGSAAPLPTLQAAPADPVAGTPAMQGNLQVETEPHPRTPVDASGTPNTELTPTTTDSTGANRLLDQSSGLAAVTPGAGEMAMTPTPSGENSAAPLSITDDAKSEAAYRDAFGALKSGEYDKAITALSAFQQQYPNSQYGDNAQFWLAEAYYVKRDFAAALPEYQKMMTNYPASKKLSHAMLKIGYSYLELGQPEQARTVLEDLQRRFPGSAAAQLAAQRLAPAH
ncbi:MAG: tol-pal system protein YbgF [Gammaproteobacteria bacterium]|nr:tol-pal system protein YbgF [Gammaproteobacteria bacterium]